ncbi:MAG: hypothetical protein ABSA83_19095 [Verrucomicrobiota bacterium]|jgi:hypothetical protein
MKAEVIIMKSICEITVKAVESIFAVFRLEPAASQSIPRKLLPLFQRYVLIGVFDGCALFYEYVYSTENSQMPDASMVKLACKSDLPHRGLFAVTLPCIRGVLGVY